MLAQQHKNPGSETLTTFWGSPILVAIGGARHAAQMAAAAAQLASPTDSMVVVYTVAAGEPVSDQAEPATRSSWVDPVLQATAMLDAYRMPYRVIVDDRPMSSSEPDRTEQVGWAIWEQARSCRSQCVVIGRHDDVEPRLQVHRHVAAVGKIPVVTVRLPGGDAGHSTLPASRLPGHASGLPIPGHVQAA